MTNSLARARILKPKIRPIDRVRSRQRAIESRAKTAKLVEDINRFVKRLGTVESQKP